MNHLNPSIDVQALPALFLQMQQQIVSLQQTVQQHTNILQRLDALEKENKQLQEDLKKKNFLIEQLRQSRTDLSPVTDINSGAAGGTQDLSTKSSQWAKTSSSNYLQAAQKGRSAKPSSPAQAQKRLLAIGRSFTTPAAKGPQGYEYVYIGRSGKIARTEVRSKFRKAGIDNGRVLDICFPATGVIGVLLHVQYVTTFRDILDKIGAQIIQDFDPLDPDNIADPQYSNLSQVERESLIQQFVEDRATQTLRFLRPLTVSSVGKYFEELGWINGVTLGECVSEAMARFRKAEPKKADFLFKRRFVAPSSDDSTDNSDSAMDE